MQITELLARRKLQFSLDRLEAGLVAQPIEPRVRLQLVHYVPLVAGREAPPATRGARNAALWDIPDDSLRLLDSEAPQRLAAYIA